MRNVRAAAICLVVLFLVSTLPAGASDGSYGGGLRPPLSQVLSQAGAGELVPVSIVLTDKATVEELHAARQGLAPRAARSRVTSLLKARASRSQAVLLARLQELYAAGQVRNMRLLWIGNVIGIEATPEVIREIAARRDVSWVNHNPKIDASLGVPYTPAAGLDGLGAGTDEIECGVSKMRAPEVWSSLGITGNGAIVAMIDTGVCHTHSDINSQMWVNPGEDLDHDGVVMDPDDMNGVDNDGNGFIDDLIGWDFDNSDNVPNDDNSHGSHTAGTVAGDGTGGSQCGMAPDAKIMAIKVGVSFADEVDVWNAMQYAADNGADTISMSLGWPHNQNPDRATWRQNSENTIEAGTAMVIAAGNEGAGAEPDNVRTPGDVPRVITVGATDCSDNLASFSSRGPVTWQNVPPYNDYPYPPGLIKPDVSAPGDNTKSHDVCSGYSFKSGTSMATPHVAGAVALMIANSPGLLNDDLKQILEETAVDLGAPGKDNEYGAGRVDAYEAVLNTATPDGRVNIQETVVSCAGLLHITVTDSNLRGAGSITIDVFSTTEPAPESVLLTETGASSGVLKGTIATGGGSPTHDSVVQTANGDTITARYIDADNGLGGFNVVKTDTASADCIGPAISQVDEQNITVSTAQIVWTTSEASSSAVHWGQTPPPGSTATSGGSVTSHSVNLSSLQSCTTYYYSVESADPQGNASLDANGGSYYSFETKGDFGSGPQPCHAGQLTLSKLILSCSDSLPVTVVDIDLNTSPSTAQTVVVSVSSSTETQPESLVLTETGANTSVFTGSIPIIPGPPVHGDGAISSANGNLITGTYHDANNGTGATAVSFQTGVADCAGPVHSGVQVTNIQDDFASVSWTTSEPATSRVDWGSTAALGKVVTAGTLVTSHSLTVGPLSECGRFFFRVTSSDAYGNTLVSDNGGVPFEFNAWKIPGLWREDFETSSAWTLEGEWQIGSPQGLGTSPGDPTAAFGGTKLLGHDLTGLGTWLGDYETGRVEAASSPVINASSLTGGQLVFRRWLNAGLGAVPTIEVKKGTTWSQVWNGGTLGIQESAFTRQIVNISQFADANSALQIRFKQAGGSNPSQHDAGWNVDRVIVKSSSQPDFTSCGGCTGAPSFAGLEIASDVNGCADTGITLSWKGAPGWGTGAAGTYSVYRDTNPAFTPATGNRIATGLATTTYTDASAPNGATLYYIVRAENAETCSTGPANGGVTDSNLVRRSAVDETTQPGPGTVGSSVRVATVNTAHVLLTWTASPTATTNHVYRGNGPQGPWTLVADTTATLYEDRDELGNLFTRYYRIEPANKCGVE